MVIGEALRWAAAVLTEAGIDTAALDARVLLMHILGVDAVHLAVRRDQPLTVQQQMQYEEWIRRREMHEPVAYITGEREFMSLSFLVRPGVLIPRPDTEVLAEYAIARCGEMERPGVLDACTGSGALAVSIAHFVPGASVTAVDISDIALNIARENAARHGVAVKFVRADVIDGLPSFAQPLDMVVSNPPYVRPEVIAGLSPDVRGYEPLLALDGGADGLVFYRALVRLAPQVLKKGGRLAFEVGYDQADAVAAMMDGQFTQIEILRDLAGNARVVAGRLIGQEKID